MLSLYTCVVHVGPNFVPSESIYIHNLTVHSFSSPFNLIQEQDWGPSFPVNSENKFCYNIQTDGECLS